MDSRGGENAETPRLNRLPRTAVAQDVDAVLWSLRLHTIRRYLHQRFWTQESVESDHALRVEPTPRLETVSEHSWSVADSVLLLSNRFPSIDSGYALKLAVLHDKMEILIGDQSPVGRDGTGRRTHAFDSLSMRKKDASERLAIDTYLSIIGEDHARSQKQLLLEALECKSNEARFVKAVDKMQALAYILWKKAGSVEDKHLRFLVDFTEKNNRYFPPLADHSHELLSRIFKACARQRQVPLDALLMRAGVNELMITIDDAGDTSGPEVIGTSSATVPPKEERLREALQQVAKMQPAPNALGAYRQIARALDRVEDSYLGAGSWSPLRYYPPGTRTERMYPIAPESFIDVPGWPGVTCLVSTGQYVFLSRDGAIEVVIKRPEDTGRSGFEAFICGRDVQVGSLVAFRKPDYLGEYVWAPKNAT